MLPKIVKIPLELFTRTTATLSLYRTNTHCTLTQSNGYNSQTRLDAFVWVCVCVCLCKLTVLELDVGTALVQRRRYVYPGGTIIEFLAPRNFTRTRGLSMRTRVVYIIDIALCILYIYIIILCFQCVHI